MNNLNSFVYVHSYNILSKAGADGTQNIYFKHLKYIKLKLIQIILPSNLNCNSVNKHCGKHNITIGPGA